MQNEINGSGLTQLVQWLLLELQLLQRACGAREEITRQANKSMQLGR